MPPPKTRVWDLPTRLFHWLLALGILAAFLTEEFGEIDWHARVGYCLLSLMLFRLAWGLWGSRYARFSDFVVGPARLFQFLKSPWQSLGHNPLGSLSVLALLSLIGLQVLTGLASTDEIMFDGPLVKHLPEDWVSLAGEAHEWLQRLLLALIGLHVAAIVFYRVVKGEVLLPAMIHGDKPLSGAAARDDGPTRLRGLLTYVAALGLVVLLLVLLD